jgi:hypothetical protein
LVFQAQAIFVEGLKVNFLLFNRFFFRNTNSAGLGRVFYQGQFTNNFDVFFGVKVFISSTSFSRGIIGTAS